MRRPRRSAARSDVTANSAEHNVVRGPAQAHVTYRRVIAELLAIAAAQRPVGPRPELGPGDPLGHLRAEPEPPERAGPG